MTGFRKGAESEIWHGHVISVAVGHFESPTGEPFEREIVHHPGAVVVVPLTDTGSIVVERQYRAAIDQHLLELPAGKRDVEGEPPDLTARRELIEEVGLQPGSLELLARFYNSPGFSDELSWLYLARDLTPVPNDRQGIEETDMTIETIELSDVPRLVAGGALVDAKTIIGLTLTSQLLGTAR